MSLIFGRGIVTFCDDLPARHHRRIVGARTFSHTSMLRPLIASLSLLAACGGGNSSVSPTPTPPPSSATVNATPSIAFNPSPLSVAVGGTVTFAFGTVGHNVFFDPTDGAPADIPGTNANVSATRTFSTAGTYTYNCHIHPGMRGTIVVGASTAPTDSSGYGGY